MKLLLENWKKYIKEELRPEDYEDEPFPEEQSEEEKAEAYLGNPKSIGEFIYRAFRGELEKQPNDLEAQLWSDRIISDANYQIKKQFPNVKYLGHGVFRTAFTLNKNLIIKVNTSFTTDSGQMMNKEDFTLSRDPQTSQMFPRVYSHDPDFNWIVMDLVYPIVTPKEFYSFFPNDIIAPILSKEPMLYRLIFHNSIRLEIARMKKNKKLFVELNNIYKTKLSAGIQKHLGKKVSMDKIVSGFNPLFFEVCNAVLKHNIRITEVRNNNTGFTIDQSGNKNFVLLDSSIDASIKKGLNEPEPKAAPPKQANPAANEKTAPIRR
jgi:hypothetical protein